MSELEIKWERKFKLSLDVEEIQILKKLLGNLSSEMAERNFGLTAEQYQITYNIYSTIDNNEEGI